MKTLVKVWENLKKLQKLSPAAHVPTAFVVLTNFHSCFYNLIEKRTCFLFLKKKTGIQEMIKKSNMLPLLGYFRLT